MTSVTQLFEEQALREPGAVALILPPPEGGGSELRVTYGELDALTGGLAKRLRSEGVQRGQIVGVLMERSIDAVVAFLGILKAGAGYLPLDPSYPQDRLDFMLADTKAPVLLAQPHLLERASAVSAHVIVPGDESGARLAAAGAVSELQPVGPDDLAYVMYTSGSTGRPKGVLLPHRGIVRLVRGNSYARLDATRTILQIGNLSFDASTWEIWGALLNGGRLVLYPGTGMPQLSTLKRVIGETGVTTLLLTTSLFNMVIDEEPTCLTGVEEVLFGGETASVPHVARAQQVLPDLQLVNAYGPTEVTVIACCYRIPRGFRVDARSVPIGSAIAETSVHILDSDLRPVPQGQPGDLYVGGNGLALGYLNLPELTAERFITPQTSGDSSGRYYQTGDRARCLTDGNLEFLGRVDDQIKMHGHRIELGEIEARLRAHVDVADVVVVMREDPSRDKQLVAYYTSRDGTQPSAADLRRHLGGQVPDYMVPTHFVPMDAIPLTPIGKADRRALPPPAATRPQLDEEYVAPRDVLETLLAEHWRELLNLDRVGVNDRLFELGATSLKTMHFMTRLSRVLGRQIPIVTVFQTGTVAEIAAKLRSEYGEVVAPLVGGMDRRRPLGARSRRDVSAARGVTPRGARDRAAVLEQRRARLRGVVGEGPAEESDD